MAFNGSGTYTLPGAALNTGDTVSATENNTLRNDMATAFNKTLCRDGQATPTANLPMGGFKLTGLAAGTASGESVRYDEFNALNTSNFGFRNRIINGAMMIDQRNAGASSTAGFPVDRWKIDSNVGVKSTQQQNAGSVTPPAGFRNYLGCTASGTYSVSAGDVYVLDQPIEGYNVADLMWGTSSAATVTLSFWVRSSITGTFGGSVNNSAATRCYPFTYTISAANTWEQKSVTIAGDTSGTWLTTNGAGIVLFFNLASGSTYQGTAGAWSGTTYYSVTGAQNPMATSGATFYITGVQLEKGSTATSFDYRPYGTELALCQRYYAKGIYSMIWGSYTTGTIFRQNISLPATQRTSTSVVLTNTTTSTANTPVVGGAGDSSWYLQASSTGTAVNAEVTGTYTASAEL